MPLLPTAFIGNNDFPFVYPTGVIVGGANNNLGLVVYNWDTSGNNFQINSTFEIKARNFYTVYFEFTITGTLSFPQLPHVVTVVLQDALNLISNPPTITIPINSNTSADQAVFQGVYSGYVSLDADFNPVLTSNGFQFQATLLPNQAQVGATGLSMTIQRLTITQTAVEKVLPYSYTIN